ncbi:hypothetical protein GCM10027614_17680 [Micromonospora vulcania]
MSDTIATLPVVVESDGRALTELITDRRTELRATLSEQGGLLFRGFDVGGVDGFDRVVRALSGEPLTYTERSSPRHAIKGRVYTSTDYPPDEEIFLHNENSYQARWPLTLFFYCITAPQTLGATPLADIRQVYREIDPAVREEFVRRRWMLVRNFHEDFGATWQHVFGTDDRAEVEAYAAANRITLEWVGADGLRTRAVRDAVHHRPGSDTPVVQPRHLLPREQPGQGPPGGVAGHVRRRRAPVEHLLRRRWRDPRRRHGPPAGRVPGRQRPLRLPARRRAGGRQHDRRARSGAVHRPRKIAVAMAEPHNPESGEQ